MIQNLCWLVKRKAGTEVLTPQQNRVAERRNRTLIEAARTMLADSKLPTTFWPKVVNIACYVQNRVLVVKPYNKNPYELFHGRTPTLSFMRPFGCPVTILNTKDHLGKFDSKADEGFFVGYSLNSKAFRVFNSRTRIVEENLHIRFSENTPNVVGSGPDWLFDIDALTRKMNYEPIIAGTQSNGFSGTKASDNAGQARKETEPDDGSKPLSDDGKKVDEDPERNKLFDKKKQDMLTTLTMLMLLAQMKLMFLMGKQALNFQLIQISLAELKSTKPKTVKVVIQEPEQGTTTTTPTTIISVLKPPQDKDKGIMIEEPMVDQVKPMKRLEQIRLDEELSSMYKLRKKKKMKKKKKKKMILQGKKLIKLEKPQAWVVFFFPGKIKVVISCSRLQAQELGRIELMKEKAQE
ncbi:ribonuclease H-like domain-containing protein [Tanacetum coccineum]|uniref:Ribonuclease H-like domain-containing protein n=1 Tax=Tanacetum coccineum TaxID=301880 RepID=A0ABQ4YQF3_9ASTR